MKSENTTFKPIFIIGCPRSGTTLLGYLLASNKKMLTTPQSNFLNEAFTKFGFSNNHTDILKFINNHWRFQAWEIKKLNNEKCMDSYRIIMNNILINYQKKYGLGNEEFWIDHTPSNIKYLRFLKKIFPESKFINIIRDGRAVASSMKPLDWGGNNVYVSSEIWKENILLGLSAEKYIGEDFSTVFYEELVENPNNELKRIANFLDIPNEFNITNGQGFKLPEYTKKQHKLIGKKPDKSRMNNWKKKLSEKEIEIFEMNAGNILDYLGYTLQSNNKYNIKFRTKFRYHVQNYLIDIFRNKRKNKERIRKTVTEKNK